MDISILYLFYQHGMGKSIRVKRVEKSRVRLSGNVGTDNDGTVLPISTFR